MKKLFLLVVFAFFSASIFSQTQVEVFGKLVEGTVTPDINVFATKKISEKVSLTAFTLVEEKWSEALVGVTYCPTSNLELGLSAGIEQNEALYRLGGSVWIGSGKTSLLILVEKGDGLDNYWYKSVVNYKVSEDLSVGISAWRFHGIGPVLKLAIKDLDCKVWINPAYDLEVNKTKIMLGLDISF